MLAGVMLCLTTNTLRAQSQIDNPESAIRGVIRAMYANDADSFLRLLVPDPRARRLTVGGSRNETALRELDEDPGGLQIILKRGFQHRGVDLLQNANTIPAGTTAVYVVAHHRSPIVMIAEKRPDGWKIDPRWWLAGMEMAADGYSERGSPAFSARGLLAALLEGDTGTVKKFTTPGADMATLFAGAPRQREPSGVLEALVSEMPIVELKPGEFRMLGNGDVVEGSADANTKVLVGLMGTVEIPFVVQKVGTDWRVRPQSFFGYINR